MTNKEQDFTATKLQPSIDELLKYIDINAKDVTGEQALWQSVIMQAVLDVIASPKAAKDKMERAKTIAWFSYDNEDFLLVCSFAELSPDFILKGVRNALKRQKKTTRNNLRKKLKHVTSLSKPNVQKFKESKFA